MGINQRIETPEEKQQIVQFLLSNEVPGNLNGNQKKVFRKRANKFKLSNGLLYYSPSANVEYKRFFCDFEIEQKREIVRVAHEAAHFGSTKNHRNLQFHYYGITREFVEEFVSACTHCLVANPLSTRQPCYPNETCAGTIPNGLCRLQKLCPVQR